MGIDRVVELVCAGGRCGGCGWHVLITLRENGGWLWLLLICLLKGVRFQGTGRL